MKCPVCKTEELDFSSLENNLTSRHCDKFGDEGFDEIQRMKEWIDGHPRKQEILAYLMSA